MQKASSLYAPSDDISEDLSSNVTVRIDNTIFPAHFTKSKLDRKNIKDLSKLRSPNKCGTLSTTNTLRFMESSSSMQKFNLSQDRSNFLKSSYALKINGDPKQRKSKPNSTLLLSIDSIDIEKLKLDDSSDVGIKPADQEIMYLECTRPMKFMFKTAANKIDKYRSDKLAWREMH